MKPFRCLLGRHDWKLMSDVEGATRGCPRCGAGGWYAMDRRFPPPNDIDKDAFVALLTQGVPEAQSILREHHDDYGEILLHLLVADLRLLCEQAWKSGDLELSGRLLNWFECGFASTDEAVNNAVGVSFVEDSRPWRRDTVTYVDSWPIGIRTDARIYYPVQDD